ncbi:MAG: DUF1189 family protein [Candidatus Magasanikbacteria bacterium]
MSFFSTLYNSLYNFKWLRDQRNNSRWAWGYFFLLIFLVAGLSTISLGYKSVEEVPKIKQALYSELPEFQAELKNGQLQVNNLAQPYIKSYDKLAIVVDTVTTGTVDIKSYVRQDGQSVVLIAKDIVTVYDTQDKSIKVQSLKEFGDLKFDRAGVLKIVDTMFGTKMFLIAMIVILALMFIFLVASNLLNVLFFSLLFYTITKRLKSDWKFKEIFTVGLFTVTLPMILVQIGTNMYLNWMSVLVFAGWMYLVVIKKDVKIDKV